MNQAAEKYMSSSKNLKADIATLGSKEFEFNILCFHRNRSIAKCTEIMLQLKHGIGEDANSYNQAIGDSKFMGPTIYTEALNQLK